MYLAAFTFSLARLLLLSLFSYFFPSSLHFFLLLRSLPHKRLHNEKKDVEGVKTKKHMYSIPFVFGMHKEKNREETSNELEELENWYKTTFLLLFQRKTKRRHDSYTILCVSMYITHTFFVFTKLRVYCITFFH